jgi:hypothetical protein
MKADTDIYLIGVVLNIELIAMPYKKNLYGTNRRKIKP